jgi:hypothetical protein
MSTDEDVPMPIKVAVQKCFPFGGIKASTLMHAIRAGRLAYEKHGRSYFVTKRDIEQWRQTSRVTVKAAQTIDRGSKDALESALRNAERLKKGLPNWLTGHRCS